MSGTPAPASTNASARSSSVAIRPVPRVGGGLPFLGQTLRFAKDPDAFVRSCREAHGPAFRARMLNGEQTFLVDPFDYPRVFAESRFQFLESGAEIGGRVFGYSKEAAMGEFSHELSEITGREMRGDALQILSERMQGYFVERMARLVGRGTIERPLLQLLTDEFFSAGVDAIFGEGYATRERYADYERIDRYFALAVAGVPPFFLPGFVRARDRLTRSLRLRYEGRASVLDARDASNAAHAIDADLAARFDVGLLWASQANTVMTAFWTLVYLLRHPEALARVRDEVRGVSPGQTLANAEPLSRDALRRLVLLDSACSEGMRLTAGPMNGRHATSDFVFELDCGMGIEVKEGDSFLLYPRDTHFDPNIFERPETFVFDRFVDERGRAATFTKGGRRLTMAVLPFGGGNSMCPGRFFARNEIKVLVATMIAWLDTELLTTALPPLDFRRIGLGTMPPMHDVDVRIRAR